MNKDEALGSLGWVFLTEMMEREGLMQELRQRIVRFADDHRGDPEGAAKAFVVWLDAEEPELAERFLTKMIEAAIVEQVIELGLEVSADGTIQEPEDAP
jgi:hypothetical protein